jgi:DNA-binding NtrC family response regulator
VANTQQSILIVDDDPIILESLSEFLRIEGYHVLTAGNYKAAVNYLEKQNLQLVIADVSMPETDGFELLRFCRQRYPQVVVIMMTGYGTIESAVEAIKMGAYEYITKPVIDEEVLLLVERAMRQQSLLRENQALRQQLEMRYGLGNLIGHDYRMLKIFDLIETVASSKTSVLIQGDSGTGKSLAARVIHHLSPRAAGPFIEVSCGAIPESLLESELFGHMKGSFTGAVSDKEGKFKAADGGTIFLDEISTASPGLQVKLLRVMQEKQLEPVGSNETQTVDVRVVLATNVDLAEEVKAGRFRQDLYYRINVVAIEMPPLRERISDIPRLAESFLEKFRKEASREVLSFDEETIKAMQRYHWPGNVRELENAVERAVVLSKGPRISVEDLPATVLEKSPSATATEYYQGASLKAALEGPEKRILESALKTNGWNRQLTSEMLEINRTTLYKKMKRYGLDAMEPS